MGVKITVVGTGYVGLVSGACLAELGHDVICCDKDLRKIEMLERGIIPIYEPGLAEIVDRNASMGSLRFSSALGASVKGRDAIFVAVGTPSNGSNGHADLSDVKAAVAEISSNLDQPSVIVIKSTVPVGTNRMVAEEAQRHLRPGIRVAIASNPEFLREGAAIDDFMRPDRIVVGADDEATIAVMKRIYAPLVGRGHRFIVTGVETAELTKYAANAFLAVKLSFINEMAALCEAVGADVEGLAIGVGADARIAPAFLKAGPGWGGSCFPKDTRALLATAREYGLPSLVVNAAVEANALTKERMVTKIEQACGGSVKGKTLGVLGLTFKGQTDDIRESPSLDVLASLVAKGAEVRAYDPSATSETRFYLQGVTVHDDPIGAVTGANALVVLTDWEIFQTYDLAALADLMVEPVMVDLRNLFDQDAAKRAGFSCYESLGRKSLTTTASSSQELERAYPDVIQSNFANTN